jgi:hypothetical protein
VRRERETAVGPSRAPLWCGGRAKRPPSGPGRERDGRAPSRRPRRTADQSRGDDESGRERGESGGLSDVGGDRKVQYVRDSRPRLAAGQRPAESVTAPVMLDGERYTSKRVTSVELAAHLPGERDAHARVSGDVLPAVSLGAVGSGWRSVRRWPKVKALP